MTPAAGVAAGPVDVVEGALASASVPVVFPPRPLADDDYVDGGVLQNVPVRAALHLGASRIIAVLAIPLQIAREEHNFSTDQAANIGLRALGVISLADRQRENLAHRPDLGGQPDHHRSGGRCGRLLRGRGRAPAHQPGLRLVAGRRRDGGG